MHQPTEAEAGNSQDNGYRNLPFILLSETNGQK